MYNIKCNKYYVADVLSTQNTQSSLGIDFQVESQFYPIALFDGKRMWNGAGNLDMARALAINFMFHLVTEITLAQ